MASAAGVPAPREPWPRAVAAALAEARGRGGRLGWAAGRLLALRSAVFVLRLAAVDPGEAGYMDCREPLTDAREVLGEIAGILRLLAEERKP